MDRICSRCGIQIPSTRRSDAKYCSSDCLKKHHYEVNQDRIKREKRAHYVPKERQQRTCPHCGAEFTATKATNTYCSKVCVKAAWQVRHSEEVAARNARTRSERAEKRIERIATRAAQRESQICATDGCQVSHADDPHFNGGMCSLHYQRARRAGERLQDLGIRMCPRCGADMSTARRNAKYCSQNCTRLTHREKHAANIRVRMTFVQNQRRAARVGNPGGVPFTLAGWLAFLKHVDYRCTYCGVQTEQLQMDHIIALSRGGPHSLANITAACGHCNPSKKDRLLLVEWAPKRLGGKPRYDRTQRRGSITNIYRPEDYRGPDGPHTHVLQKALEWSELYRVIEYSEKWIAAAGAASDNNDTVHTSISRLSNSSL